MRMWTQGCGHIVNIRRERHFTLAKLSTDNYFIVLRVTGCAGCAMPMLYVGFNIRKQADFNAWVSSSRLKIILPSIAK